LKVAEIGADPITEESVPGEIGFHFYTPPGSDLGKFLLKVAGDEHNLHIQRDGQVIHFQHFLGGEWEPYKIKLNEDDLRDFLTVISEETHLGVFYNVELHMIHLMFLDSGLWEYIDSHDIVTRLDKNGIPTA